MRSPYLLCASVALKYRADSTVSVEMDDNISTPPSTCPSSTIVTPAVAAELLIPEAPMGVRIQFGRMALTTTRMLSLGRVASSSRARRFRSYAGVLPVDGFPGPHAADNSRIAVIATRFMVGLAG